ncbi:MAG: gliding motility-associated protein GldE [Ferruginibacter sp.]|nr:gliding motility-associated protein GldE [Chitinophagaceae bacterium]MBP6285987.1 gliding motility-associated protein GldE [Ferruginibacter sp.]MBU9936011.1 gliding motility-associated protein GldE [Ferruginibacter sp.]HQY10720.1 gliding motility-associated protein GldE [Ferruginibacter sp.]
MDHHSVHEFIGLTRFFFLAITPAATTVLIILVILLFMLSFLMAGSEIAFFSLTFKDINVLKTKKQPAYRRIVSLLDQPKTLLASMLISNSFINIGIILISNILIDSWIAGLQLTFWPVFLLKVGSVTFLLLLFGEVLPKVWATHHKIWFAATASLVIEIFGSIFYRFSKRMVRLSDRVERRFSSESSSTMDSSNLDYAIDLLPEHEATSEEKSILKGIRKFGDTTVKQVMRTRLDVCGIDHSYPFRDVIKKIEELHYSRLPVYRHNLDEVVGMLHTKDILPFINEPAEFDWHTLMRQPYFVHEQKLIEDLLQEFRNRRIHFAVVVDEFGGTSGIVTLEDVMEEIIGEIKDEFDEEESNNKKIDDHNYIFEGKTMINDACKAMKLPADTFDALRGDSDSLAGLVLEIAGEFPQVNEEVASGDYIFVPLEIHKNRLDKIKITIKPANPE